jgi:hypothetical protein
MSDPITAALAAAAMQFIPAARFSTSELDLIYGRVRSLEGKL